MNKWLIYNKELKLLFMFLLVQKYSNFLLLTVVLFFGTHFFKLTNFDPLEYNSYCECVKGYVAYSN